MQDMFDWRKSILYEWSKLNIAFSAFMAKDA